MQLSWKDLAPIFARLGMPLIAWVLDKLPVAAGEAVKGLPFGGLLSGAVEKGARAILNQAITALGLDPTTATPDDVHAAVQGGETSDVVARLKAVEAEAAARWPALVEIVKAEIQGEVEVGRINAETFLARARAEAGTNNPWLTAYKPVLLFGLTIFVLYLIGIVLYAVTVGGPMVESIKALSEILMTILGTCVGILTGWIVTRASERKALLGATPANAPTTTTVVSTTAPTPTPVSKVVKAATGR